MPNIHKVDMLSATKIDTDRKDSLRILPCWINHLKMKHQMNSNCRSKVEMNMYSQERRKLLLRMMISLLILLSRMTIISQLIKYKGINKMAFILLSNMSLQNPCRKRLIRCILGKKGLSINRIYQSLKKSLLMSNLYIPFNNISQI